MSQNPMRFCVQCGVQNPLSQPFCSNCGARQDLSNSNDIPSNQNNPYAPYQQGVSSSQYGGYQQSAPSTQYGGGYQQSASSPQYGGYQQPYQQTPLYAQPQPNSADNAATGIVAAFLGLLLLREVKSRVIGCVFTLIIVVAIVACALIANH